MGVNKIIPVEGSQSEKTNGMKTEPRGNKQTHPWGVGAATVAGKGFILR